MKALIRATWREPLFHFLGFGGVLFVLFSYSRGADIDAGDRTIVVDRDALLTFVQYRTKSFQIPLADARLNALSPSALQRLIDDYIKEEALHREALSRGLDSNDYIIKRRLIQKVEFIANGFADEGVEVDQAALEQYFDRHREDYRIDAFVTFTHVFFDNERHGHEQAWRLAQAKLVELRQAQATFNDSLKHGDRFPYHANYVERRLDFVGSHFGTAMADAVFALAPSEDHWYGPLKSDHGVHLVLLTQHSPMRDPDLADVRERVIDDARKGAIQQRQQAAIQAIVDGYDIRLDYHATEDAVDARLSGTP